MATMKNDINKSFEQEITEKYSVVLCYWAGGGIKLSPLKVELSTCGTYAPHGEALVYTLECLDNRQTCQS